MEGERSMHKKRMKGKKIINKSGKERWKTKNEKRMNKLIKEKTKNKNRDSFYHSIKR